MSPHLFNLESLVHLLLLIQISLTIVWRLAIVLIVNTVLDLMAEDFLLFKLAYHEVFDSHALLSLLDLPKLLRLLGY